MLGFKAHYFKRQVGKCFVLVTCRPLHCTCRVERLQWSIGIFQCWWPWNHGYCWTFYGNWCSMGSNWKVYCLSKIVFTTAIAIKCLTFVILPIISLHWLSSDMLQVATVVTLVHEMENGFNIWSFNGKHLYQKLKDNFFQVITISFILCVTPVH